MNKEQIQQKFNEMLDGLGWIFYNNNCDRQDITKSDLIELLESAYNLGLEVAADNAEADCHVFAGDTGKEFIETYVLKESILKHKL